MSSIISCAWQRLKHSIFVFSVYIFLCLAVSSEKPLAPLNKPVYKAGQAIPVSCLNRTIDTGEHIQDEKGRLQYIPFPNCNETGRPLELHFGVEKDVNCTIPFISDPFFHLLEFYIHNDAPLTCRVPSRPLSDPAAEHAVSSSSSPTNEDEYIPLTFALSGVLQLSHLHVASAINILLHTSPISPFVVNAATAYSTSPAGQGTKIVIGDALPLKLSVRWYPTTKLPSGWAGVGGHVHVNTVVYAALGFAGGVLGSLAWFRGVELPKRMKRAGLGVGGARGGGYGLPAGTGWGKRD